MSSPKGIRKDTPAHVQMPSEYKISFFSCYGTHEGPLRVTHKGRHCRGTHERPCRVTHKGRHCRGTHEGPCRGTHKGPCSVTHD